MGVFNRDKFDPWRKLFRSHPKGRTKLNIKAIAMRPPSPRIHNRITGSQLCLQQRSQLSTQPLNALCIDRIHDFTQPLLVRKTFLLS
jgi:hypothetical protein